MPPAIRRAASCTLIVYLAQTALAQTGELHGQASGWLTGNSGTTPVAQSGIRYIPDLLVREGISEGFDADMELSVNAYATAQIAADRHPSYDWNAGLYRAWLRLGTDRLETRIGLQKISFGTAQLLRPLMWFDRVDPRDPLLLTEGVYGALARYYFPNNANIWLWGLYGNNDAKGWELSPTEKRTLEYGGRVQSPLWSGEVGLTYHHRRADLGPIPAAGGDTSSTVAPEDRLGLDGKWDVGIGVWFEAVLVRQESGNLPARYQRLWTAGADYTFPVGNGLYLATEYFRSDELSEPFSSGEGGGVSAVSLNYPFGVVDRVSVLLYRDWENHQWYRMATWQRTYDNWSLYLLGFWNPEHVLIYHTQAGANPFAGTGIQIMATFNH